MVTLSKYFVLLFSGGGTGGQGGTVAPGRRRMGGTAPGDGAKNFLVIFFAML